ncbi:hypothetical protein ACEWY4_028022 [Coilia grayii]|uniref:Adhesion G protein-coupled receptor B N-terminal domain-containing protein n=1 Tax=Coilia grayii TaxID=363190 RepID=A0ABD1IQA3_9TELE
MTPAGQLCLSVLCCVLARAWCSAGAPGEGGASAFGPCSSLVSGVLYGSFSLRDLFPGPGALARGCSWTVENPDPTKYSLYFRFNQHAAVCGGTRPPCCPSTTTWPTTPAPPRTCPCPPTPTPSATGPPRHAFLQFDKNFVQLCLTAQPGSRLREDPGAERGVGHGGEGRGGLDGGSREESGGEGRGGLDGGSREESWGATAGPLVATETLDFRLVEVLLINNENSSRFTCGVLCRWVRGVRARGVRPRGRGRGGEGCSITQTGCVCPNAAPPPATDTLPPDPPHNHTHHPVSNVLLTPPDDCCVTQTHPNNAIAIAPRDVRQGKAAWMLFRYSFPRLSVITRAPPSSCCSSASVSWVPWASSLSLVCVAV